MFGWHRMETRGLKLMDITRGSPFDSIKISHAETSVRESAPTRQKSAITLRCSVLYVPRRELITTLTMFPAALSISLARDCAVAQPGARCARARTRLM